MGNLRRTRKTVIALILVYAGTVLFQACQKEDRISPDETTLRFRKLSEYKIFQGNPRDLVPTDDYKLYELSSQLFTDYAEKQRLIKIPSGTTMQVVDNGLLKFPEGTVIVKTFYYFRDKRNPSLGKRLIETRILELINGKWIAGTYKWNESQTDAHLLSIGLNQSVNWIDEGGSGKVISYRIPGNIECRTCHNSNKAVVPIGPKTQNLNLNVYRNGNPINQLTHFYNEGYLNAVDPTAYLSVPDYNDFSRTIEERGRAYLDANCAHCHNEKGFASQFKYRMNYETNLNTSKIREGKVAIRVMTEKGNMPKIGTTVIDKEGVELIKKYLETL